MKKFYSLILFLFLSFSYAQTASSNGDIADFNMYPNPATGGKVFISTQLNHKKEVHIYDVLGTLILKTTLVSQELNIATLDAGVYVIRVFEKDKIATRKLIIK